MSGDIIVSNVYDPITWDTFQEYTDAEKEAWLIALTKRYKGITIRAITQMWNGEHYCTLQKYIKGNPNIKLTRNQPFEDQAKYESEVLSKITPIDVITEEPKEEIPSEITSVSVSTVDQIIATITPPEKKKVENFVSYCELTCNAEDIPQIFSQLAFTGRVTIKVSKNEDSL